MRSTNITLELSPNQVDNLIERLPLIEKIRIARRLSMATWQARFKNLIAKIDSHARRHHPVSNPKIVQIVKKVRKRNYDQGHH